MAVQSFFSWIRNSFISSADADTETNIEPEHDENWEFLKPKPDFATVAIHAGQEPEKWKTACVIPPIITSTTFKQPSPGEPLKFKYGRIGNPTRNTLEECVAALEDAKYCLGYASGLAAVSTVATLLSKGDHVVVCDDCYAAINRLFRTISSRMGIESSFVDYSDLNLVKNSMKKNTRMVWIETPSNPLLKVYDIQAIVNIVRQAGDGILVVVDNTFLTSYLQRPLDFGVDLVVCSLSKYMNGHCDIISGCVTTNSDDLEKKLRNLQEALGGVPSPFDCYLANRSLKTLSLRIKRQQKSSLIIAKWLMRHPKVEKVNHPGLPCHPQYEITKRQTCGHSGVFSFSHKGGLKESKIFLKSLKVFTLAESLGGYESLAGLPCLMTHVYIPRDMRIQIGIVDSLIRLSVGLEDVEFLIKDLEDAFTAAF